MYFFNGNNGVYLSNLSQYPPILPTPHFPDGRFILDLDTYFNGSVKLE